MPKFRIALRGRIGEPTKVKYLDVEHSSVPNVIKYDGKVYGELKIKRHVLEYIEDDWLLEL